MMRYQGMSPENLPLSNGRRSHWRTCKEDENFIGNREVDEENDDAKTIPNFVEGPKGVPKFRSSSSKTTQDHNFSPFSTGFPNSLPKNKDPPNQELNNNTTPLHNGGGSGDMLLQWGHRKRSRISRSTTVAGATTGGGSMADDSSSSSSTQVQGMMKIPRRSITLPTPATGVVIDTKSSSNTNIMPPPSSILPNTISITNSSTSNGKVGNHKSSSKDNSPFVNRRNLEDRSGGGSGPHPPRNGSNSRAIGVSGSTAAAGVAAGSSSRSKLGKRSPQKVLEKNDQRKMITTPTTTTACSSGSASLKSDEKINGLGNQEFQEVGGFGVNQQQNIASASPQEAAGCSTNNNHNHNHNHDDMSITKATTAAAANGGGEVYEWPRVQIPLTRKEKEEDFLLMKGTKLPHRPKKRPKAVDRMLQYCFPGTWLCDVTKARYEVKEKKCTTKKPKRRGLKGMESVETDSE